MNGPAIVRAVQSAGLLVASDDHGAHLTKSATGRFHWLHVTTLRGGYQTPVPVWADDEPEMVARRALWGLENAHRLVELGPDDKQPPRLPLPGNRKLPPARRKRSDDEIAAIYLEAGLRALGG